MVSHILPANATLGSAWRGLTPTEEPEERPAPATGERSPVLVPVDAVAEASLLQGLRGLGSPRCRLVLLSTLKLDQAALGTAGNFLEFKANLFATERSRLAQLAERLRQLGHQVAVEVRLGALPQAVREVAHDHQVGLLMLERWKPSLLSKSLSQVLVEQAPCPVLLVSRAASGPGRGTVT